MDTLFRVVAASQWEQALATGWVPRCPADERRDRVHLNERKDVERVAGLWFSQDEQPVALELDVTSVASSLCWEPRAEEPFETWPNLHIRNIPVGIVVAVHPLRPDPAGGFRCWEERAGRMPVPQPGYSRSTTRRSIDMPASNPIGPTLETPRLILRPPSREDFESWVQFMADVERTRYIGGAQPRAVVWRGLAAMVGSWVMQGFAMFSVIEKSSGRWIGRLGPWCPEGWPGTEVGWSIVTDAGRKGYATEGSAAAIDWAFDHLGWSEVIHTIHPDNVASKAVAARLGSRYLRMGRLPPPYDAEEIEVWGQSREQWRARGAAAS